MDTHIAGQLEELNKTLASQRPKDILKECLNRYEKVVISFSGAEDVVLVDMAHKLAGSAIHVFSLDTGRLHYETYRYLDAVRKHYGIELEVLSPDANEVETLVKTKGLFSFYQDDHKECCGIRKVRPLRKKLSTVNAWVTGQRRDQSPDTRSNVDVLHLDDAFSTDDNPLVKINPLAQWTSAQVWDYIRANDVPFNALHRQGFTSIGCEPCTRPVLPNQHEREGRWWWEDATTKECGLHSATPDSR